MKISRTRIAISGLMGLTAAVVALGMATLLGHQDDPALAQSTDLRSQFTPHGDTDNPVDALRTPNLAPIPPVVQLAAPAATASSTSGAAPAAQPTAAPAAAAQSVAPAVEVAQLDSINSQEPADGGERDGGGD